MDRRPSRYGAPSYPVPSYPDADHMREALGLAALGPLPDPNPRVGCVLLDAAGEVAGRGHHRGAGTPHAEVEALRDAQKRGCDARGGTAYVTLEPCDHTGRTGPCTEALLAAGVARVAFAQRDPDPVAGGGAERLRAAGVDVVQVTDAVVSAEADQLNHAWTTATTKRLPMVTWKVAASLDGRSAAADGSSRWVTGPTARADVHDLRARCDAVLVGTGTVLADDPALTTRRPDGSLRPRQPLRVVVGERDLPTRSRVLDHAAPTLQVRTRSPLQALQTLWDKGVRHVLLEGGPTVAAAFVAAGLVDEIVAYVAPVLLGAGPSAVADLGVTSIDAALRLETLDVTTVGPDVRITARFPLTSPATSSTTSEEPS